jgi:hypothetical protein
VEKIPSWEANNHSASLEISCHLWNPKVYYHFHKSPPLVRILSKMHQTWTVIPCLFTFHLNIIILSTPMSTKVCLGFRFADWNFVCISHISLCLSCYVHPNIPLGTWFWNFLNLCFFLNVRDQVSHPYKGTGEISVFNFLDRRRKTLSWMLTKVPWI